MLNNLISKTKFESFFSFYFEWTSSYPKEIEAIEYKNLIV